MAINLFCESFPTLDGTFENMITLPIQPAASFDSATTKQLFAALNPAGLQPGQAIVFEFPLTSSNTGNNTNLNLNVFLDGVNRLAFIDSNQLASGFLGMVRGVLLFDGIKCKASLLIAGYDSNGQEIRALYTETDMASGGNFLEISAFAENGDGCTWTAEYLRAGVTEPALVSTDLPAPYLTSGTLNLIFWTWSGPSPIHWLVEYSADNGATWIDIAPPTTDGSARQFTWAPAYKGYLARISGRDSSGNQITGYSNYGLITT